MKKTSLWVAASLALMSLIMLRSPLYAEPTKTADHRIVFELTSADAKSWSAVLNNIENARKALGKADAAVVAHGEGLSMMISAKNAAVSQRMSQLAETGVQFMACANTMQKQNVKKEELSRFVKVTDSGVAEVVRKQEAGWSYLKSGS